MARSELLASMARIPVLAGEIEQQLPASKVANAELRADLAGLLTVLTCASYESCVKMILNEYASSHNIMFGIYVSNRYEKINSRIGMADLYGYCKTFHPDVIAQFKSELDRRKRKIALRFRVDIEISYEQLLRWRHEFAHTGARSTTIEEVLRTHIFAQRVLYCFDKAFSVVSVRTARKSEKKRRVESTQS